MILFSPETSQDVTLAELVLCRFRRYKIQQCNSHHFQTKLEDRKWKLMRYY